MYIEDGIFCDAQYTSYYGTMEVHSCSRQHDHDGHHLAFWISDKREDCYISWYEAGAISGIVADGGVYRFCRECDIQLVSPTDKENYCFHCYFWREKLGDPNYMIIDGYSYMWGMPRGHGGKFFSIESLADQQVVTRNGLWAQGKVPEHFRDRFPDTHRFVWKGPEPAEVYYGYGAA